MHVIESTLLIPWQYEAGIVVIEKRDCNDANESK